MNKLVSSYVKPQKNNNKCDNLHTEKKNVLTWKYLYIYMYIKNRARQHPWEYVQAEAK